MKFKLILVTVLALGGMSYAQGFVSHLSLGLGLQGVFPGSTFTKDSAENLGNANTQTTTNSVGAVFGARYDFGQHSAFDFAVTINRNSEIFFPSSFSSGFTGYLERAQTNDSEFIGSYIYRLPVNPKIKPFAMIGGGMVHFSPNNNFVIGNVAPSSQTKPAFAYGFGVDIKVSDHFAVRAQYRGLVRSQPDFGLLNNPTNPFGTGQKVNVSEPSLQVVYHF